MSSEIITDKNLIPWYRRPLFSILCALLCIPAELLIMWTGPSYFRVKGGYAKVGLFTKAFLSVLGVAYMIIALVGAIGSGSQTENTASLSTPHTPNPASPSSTSTSDAHVADSSPTATAASCSDPALKRKEIDAVNSAYDKLGVPRLSENDTSFIENQIEANDEYGQQMKRTLVATSNGAYRPEQITICVPTAHEDSFDVILISKGGAIGGVIFNFGIPGQTAKFGDDLGQ